MQPEQVSGTLFILLTAAAAWYFQDMPAILVLAAGCACGWQSYSPDERLALWAKLAALCLWVFAFILVLWRLL